MKRASSHVDALKHRLTQLQDAIDQDQDYLSVRRVHMLSRSQLISMAQSTQDFSNPFTARQPITDTHIQDLQDSLKREELELISLRVTHEERLQHKQKEKQLASAQEKKRAHMAEKEHAKRVEAEQQRRREEDQERKAAEDEKEERRRAQEEASVKQVVSEPSAPPAAAPAPGPVLEKPFSTELLDRIAVCHSRMELRSLADDLRAGQGLGCPQGSHSCSLFSRCTAQRASLRAHLVRSPFLADPSQAELIALQSIAGCTFGQRSSRRAQLHPSFTTS